MTTFPDWMDPSLRENYVRDIYIFDAYDGDTVYFHANLGYGQWAMFQTGRLLDINAPEMRPLKSRDKAAKSLRHLNYLITHYALNRHQYDSMHVFGCKVKARSQRVDNRWFSDLPEEGKGKFGRWLLTLIGADDEGLPVNLNELMIRDGYAEPYGEAAIAALGFSPGEVRAMNISGVSE